jgi:VanZ family protein
MRPADRAIRVAALVAWMSLLFYWSSQSTLPVIDQPEVASALHGVQHRIAHVFAYGLLGLLAYCALEGAPRRVLLAVLLSSAYGATDEFHQSFTPGRRAAADDWLLDTISAALVLYLWLRITASDSWSRLIASRGNLSVRRPQPPDLNPPRSSISSR